MKRTLAVLATALTLGLGISAEMLVAPAHAGTAGLADLSALGYSLGVRVDVSASPQCQNYWVLSGNGAPETLLGDPRNVAGCNTAAELQARIDNLLADYPPPPPAPVTVTVTLPALTVTQPAVTMTDPAVTLPAETVTSPPVTIASPAVTETTTTQETRTVTTQTPAPPTQTVTVTAASPAVSPPADASPTTNAKQIARRVAIAVAKAMKAERTRVAKAALKRRQALLRVRHH